MKNPFFPNMVPPPREFSIARPEEKTLRERLESPCRVLIEGPRRTGKTSLVRSCVPAASLVAIDWKDLSTPQEAWQAMESQVTKFLTGAKPIRKKLEALRKQGFHFEAGILGTGIKVGLHPAPIGSTLDLANQVGDLLTALDKVAESTLLVLYIDEIQDLAASKDGLAFLGQLRGKLQLLTNLRVVFSGSVRSLLEATFYHGESPFYRQYEAFPLSPIEDAQMVRWVRRLFAKKKLQLTDEGAEQMKYGTRWILGDVQRFASYLWNASDPGSNLGAGEVSSCLRDFVASNRSTYETFVRRYTSPQKGVLRAMAWREASMAKLELTSADVRRVFGYESGAVPNAIRTFEKDKISIDDPHLGLRLDDPFFAVYLRDFWNVAI